MSSTTYDEVPYESFPYPDTHPGQLAVIAKLFGLKTPNPKKFSYLEIGCAAGGNLFPLAMQFPESEFVGIDYAAVQVEEGLKTVNDLNLTNLQLLSKNILDIDKDFGSYDFIIAHGIYSWVPDDVREKLIQICQENLKPEGIAYLSYNTYPGWKNRETVREMLLYQTASDVTLEERGRQAIDFLKMYDSSLSDTQSLYSQMLKREVQQALSVSPLIIMHDYLSDNNKPVYFHEFVKHMDVNGLTYVGDMPFQMMRKVGLSPEVVQKLTIDPNSFVEIEQYMDYSRNRYFRRSLVTHKNRNVQRLIKEDAVPTLHFGLTAEPSAGEPDSKDTITFSLVNGAKTTADNPIAQTLLTELHNHWPKTISFDRLLKTLKTKHKKKFPDVNFESFLIRSLLLIFSNGYVNAYPYDIQVMNKVSDRPKASELARYQATNQAWVTNQRHEYIECDDFGLQLIQLLDGAKNKKDLCAELEKVVKSGLLVLDDSEKNSGPGEDQVKYLVRQALNRTLTTFLNKSLLIG